MITLLGLKSKKEEDFSAWYTEIVKKSELIDYYDVSGCYILRPWAYKIWELIQEFLNQEFQKEGVENCYFPMFVTKGALERETRHIEDFSPEVAWVTHSGNSEMNDPVAIRPTSETVMYPYFAKWIQSHRDLPLRLNQWCNVVRWEFSHPTPFIRSREFLWQEGHSAFLTRKEADLEVYRILDLYRQVYEDLLAVPVIPGIKSEEEKFPGGEFTTTVEAYIPGSGRGVQGATSHGLGQNFSKMFNLSVENSGGVERVEGVEVVGAETKDASLDGDSKHQLLFQNSWGISTRTIGVAVMVHSDNKGLVLPPAIAPLQVVLCPCGITTRLSEEDRAAILGLIWGMERELKAMKIRVKSDLRENYSPGWRYNYWELRGVPIRLDVGPRDVQRGEVTVFRRDTREKQAIPKSEIIQHVVDLLDTIQRDMFTKAKNSLDENLVKISNKDKEEGWSLFTTNLQQGRLLLVPWCQSPCCEKIIKLRSAVNEGEHQSMGAKSLCIPIEQEEIGDNQPCINSQCSQLAQVWGLFGKSY